MTQLLISVKNIAETKLALSAGVDIIDLKNPEVGALGALDLPLTEQIVRLVDSQTLTSATVGEQHANLSALLESIKARASIGVDIIKIAVAEFFHQDDFEYEMRKLSQKGIQLVAVLFADADAELARDVRFFEKLQNAGFYGAMVDTKHKQENLLKLASLADLQLFAQLCQKYELHSGLAGSLQVSHLATLLNICPNYLGFRGGVCVNNMRKEDLSFTKTVELKSMLHNHNINRAKARNNLHSALHS